MVSLSSRMQLSAKICHLNVRSLIPHFSDLKEVTYLKYDIITLSETWLNNSIDDRIISLKGYTLFRRDRISGRGGGLAAFIKNKFRVVTINNLPQTQSEQLWLSVSMNNKKVALGLLYRPPNFSVDSFLSEVDNNLSILTLEYNSVIGTGDINIDMCDLSASATIKLHDILGGYSLKQIIEEPTRYGPSSAKVLDIIFCSEEMFINSIAVEEIAISDHCLISCEIGTPKHSMQPFLYTYRDFSHFNEALFTANLNTIGFERVLYLNNVDEKIKFFNESLLNIYQVHAPIKTVKITKPKSPWITYNMRQMMKTRDRARNKYKTSKDERDFNFYKELRNQVKYALIREKKAYLEFKIRNSNNSRKFWKELKALDISAKQKTVSLPDHLSNIEQINNYFIESSTSDDEPNQDTLNFFKNNVKQGLSVLNFSETNELTIYKTLLSIKSKAVGPDKIGIDMILHACPTILPYICHIFNFCINNNVFPDIWKQSHVIPLPKVPNPLDLKSLRPISILCVLAKAFEKILNYEIKDHIETNNILPPMQSGFRAQHSCTTALLKVTDDIHLALDDNKLVALALIDYTKAFDRIKHSLLLQLCHYNGFSGNAISLLGNYLQNRSQAVLLNNTISEFKGVSNGVPQGSILGPVLFALYTSEFYKKLNHTECHFYADDTQVYISFQENEVQPAIEQLNTDLRSLLAVSGEYCLSINPAKSNVMLFGRKSARDICKNEIQVVVNEEILPISDISKNLGVLMDTSLKYTNHVNLIIKRAFSNLKLIYANRHFLNTKCRKMLCESLVLSHLNFADTLYGPSLLKSDLRRLQLIQNSCVRLICGLKKRDHVTSSIKEIGWLNIRKRQILHLCTLYHRLLNCRRPAYLYNKIKFRTDVHNLNVRFKYKLHTPKHRTVAFQSSFSYMIANLYNEIPQDMHNLSVPKFKRTLRKMLLADKITFNSYKN